MKPDGGLFEGKRGMSEYEDCVRAEIERCSRVCVHYRPIEAYGHEPGSGCARAVPIRAKAKAGNGGSAFGIALRLPCDAAPSPLFSCPWYEAKGVDRAAAELTALREAGARVLKRIARQIAESR